MDDDQDGERKRRIEKEIRAEFLRDGIIAWGKLTAIIALPTGAYLLYMDPTYWYFILPFTAIFVLPGAALFRSDWKKARSGGHDAQDAPRSAEEIDNLLAKAKAVRAAYIRVIVMLVTVTGIMAFLALEEDYVRGIEDLTAHYKVLAFTAVIIVLVAIPYFRKGWRAHAEVTRLEEMDNRNNPVDKQ